DNLVLPDDRAPTRAAYRAVLAAGGRTTVQYRVLHGKTGQLRHVIGTIAAVVDAEGALLRALATHADITEAVQAQASKVSAAQARTLLLRSVSDAFTQAPSSLRSMMQSIVDIATAVLGDGTVLRVFTADATGVEADLVSDSDAAAGSRVLTSLHESARTFVQEPSCRSANSAAGELLSSRRDPGRREDFETRLGCPVTTTIQHYISAAVRHDGLVLGYLHVHRANLDNPYEDGDDHLIQVLADRIGSAIAESRIRELMEQQLTERSAIAKRLHQLIAEQRELLEQLSGVEERERILLAEAIHDGPMQLVVAVMMRLETMGMNGGRMDEVQLEISIETLETSIRNLRTLIIALTPPDLSRGLGVALRQLAEGIFMGTTTEITVLGLAHVHLTALSKGNAHRILREALVNTRKHARATHVVLELTEENNTVIARLTDDGVGATSFDAGPGHLGMATMRARADAEGARLDISCSPGRGTTVVLTLPAAAVEAGR
ncbi:MAG: ATP-binding protein, partial [Nakamurella sp.]